MTCGAEARVQAAFAEAREAMLVCARDGRILAINRAMQTLLDHPATAEPSELNLLALLARPEQMCDVLEMLFENRRFENLALSFKRPDGSSRALRVYGLRLEADDECFLVAASAMTETSDEPPARAGMKAVERLASGVAHDLNNVLSAMAGYSHLLRDSLEGNAIAVDDLGAIDDATDRAAMIVRQLLALGKKQILTPVMIGPSRRVRESQHLLRRALPSEIDLDVVIESAAGDILVDADAFDDILMILVLNAKRSMPAGGRLRLRVSSVPHEGRVSLEVTDQGPGLDTQDVHRCFDPFASTEGAGGYSGLALAAVHALVIRSGGTITVRSTPGTGTTFQVTFPLVKPASVSYRGDAGDTLGASPMAGATVLLVEDDSALRILAHRVLTGRGCDVIEARSGEEALALLATVERPIDVVVTDMMMPGVKGWDVGHAVRRQHPQCGIVFVSGYSDDGRIRHALPEDSVFLGKPFTPPKLLAAVVSVLMTRVRRP